MNELAELRKTWRWGESLILSVLAFSALISILVTIAIVVVLVWESSAFLQNVPLNDFLFGKRWAPLFEPASFGVLPLLAGTFLVSGIACLIAVPFGLGIAIYLAEYASRGQRRWMKPTLELLAGIPSVVFGYFAVTVITPVIMSWWPDAEMFNALSAGLVVGVMALPLVASLSDDAITAVPQSLKDGGYAMGATKFEVITELVLPTAASGIVASFILALARAIGETMAVTMAAGSSPNLSLNPLQSVQTMTAFIAQTSMGDTPHGSIGYQSIFMVGLLLLTITMFVNALASRVSQRMTKNIRMAKI